MDDVCLGAYEAESDALIASSSRSEPQGELVVLQDGDVSAPFRIWWHRPAEA